VIYILDVCGCIEFIKSLRQIVFLLIIK